METFKANNLPTRAIIWDCDGVLIDSETLACSAAADVLTENGHPIGLEDYLARFMGKGLKQILAEIDVNTGLNLSETFPAERLRERQKELFDAHLKPTNGIHDTLTHLGHLSHAVASGSERDRLHHTLSLTQLQPLFKGHIYSAEMVAKGKPAPDIFLLAAEKLGVTPENCLVVEDSPHGIKAAHAAGMRVVAFAGNSHLTPALVQKLIDEKPLTVLHHMQEIITFVNGDNTPCPSSPPPKPF